MEDAGAVVFELDLEVRRIGLRRILRTSGRSV
jgi:hypothetical protein